MYYNSSIHTFIDTTSILNFLEVLEIVLYVLYFRFSNFLSKCDGENIALSRELHFGVKVSRPLHNDNKVLTLRALRGCGTLFPDHFRYT